MTFSEYLTEARQEQTYGYHATNMTHLRSILKQGLKPNHSDGGYGSDEVSSHGTPLTPLPGVYFTTTGRKAEHIGKANYDAPVIIVAKVSPNSRSVDEDNFSKLFPIKKVMAKLSNGESVDNATRDLLASEDAKNTMARLHPKGQKSVERYLRAYVDSIAHYYQVGDSADYTKEKGNEAAKVLKNAEFALTKALSYYTQTDREMDKTDQNTFKIDGVVGFSGRNRIVGIYDPTKSVGWGDIGDFERIAYHIYDTPMKLLPKDAP